MGEELLEATKEFYKFLLAGDFAAVEDMLSPDCRIQDQLEGGRGANSLEKCLEKLKELYTKTSRAKLNMTMKGLFLTKNLRQTRFIANPRVAFTSMIIGFALEWQSGIIICIVITKDTTEAAFFEDNTTAPAEITIPAEITSTQISMGPDIPSTADTPSFASDPLPTPPSPTAAVEPPPPKTKEDTSESLTTESVSTTPSKVKWYPGKFMGRRQSSTNAADAKPSPFSSSSSASASQFTTRPRTVSSTISRFTAGHSLQPPFLVPQPPSIPPTLAVTVCSCTGLKSRLNRLVTRPINAYVVCKLGSSQSRQTAVVHNSPNPKFEQEKFIFEIGPQDEYVNFIVKDKHLLDEDILAEVRIPLASLKCQVSSNDPPISYTVTLNLLERRFGKGLRPPISQLGADGGPFPSMTVLLTKVDIIQWWVLEELRTRDELKEKQIKEAEEQRKKLREAERLKDIAAGNTTRTTRKASLSAPAASLLVHIDTTTEKLNQWVDSDECTGCGDAFSLIFNRKHHCRVCGHAFCGNCSADKVVINGAVSRACSTCASPVPSASTATAAAATTAFPSTETSSAGASTAPSTAPSTASGVARAPASLVRYSSKKEDVETLHPYRSTEPDSDDEVDEEVVVSPTRTTATPEAADSNQDYYDEEEDDEDGGNQCIIS